jgi:hypothetical protein
VIGIEKVANKILFLVVSMPKRVPIFNPANSTSGENQLTNYSSLLGDQKIFKDLAFLCLGLKHLVKPSFSWRLPLYSMY